jgi:hypothetical protein
MTVAPTGLHHRPVRHGFRLGPVLFVAAAIAVGVLIGYWLFGDSTSSGTQQGSGNAVAQTRSVGAFTGVELAGGNIVSIRVGAPRSVVVHADDNLLHRVTTAVQGGHLVIGQTSGSFSTKTPMRVEVTTPSLDTITLSGSGIVTVAGVDGASFTIAVPGSGVVRASGTTSRLDVSVAGSGDAELYDLAAKDVHASVPGSGRVAVTATQSLDASISGSGAVTYAGNPPQVTTHVTGSGAVVPVG